MNASGREVKQSVKYGIRVWEDYEGESMRKQICLCLHCARLVTQEDIESLVEPSPANPANFEVGRQLAYERQIRIEELTAAYNCPIAQNFYANCMAGGVAAPVVRCPMFIDKSRIKPEGE